MLGVSARPLSRSSLRNCGEVLLRNIKMASANAPKDILGFEVKDIDGNLVSLSKYKGFVSLIVNVASKCGFTNSNYTQLQELHTKYFEKGLRILAFPCNQFGGQEPGDEAAIKVCAKGFEVGFDMFSKIDVNGNDAHPLYVFLKTAKGGFLGDRIKWNFTKFLCDKKGVPYKRYAPTTSPKSIEKDISELLNAD